MSNDKDYEAKYLEFKAEKEKLEPLCDRLDAIEKKVITKKTI